MHLNSLHIKNFKLLEDFSVSKLGHVNLIVGGNNSGKSTVLEALYIYGLNAHPYALALTAANRGENPDRIFDCIESLFSVNATDGNDTRDGEIIISCNDPDNKITIRKGWRCYRSEKNPKYKSEDSKNRVFMKKYPENDELYDEIEKAIKISGISYERTIVNTNKSDKEIEEFIIRNYNKNYKCSFVGTTPKFIYSSLVNDMDQLKINGEDEIAVDFLKLIDPNVIGVDLIGGQAGLLGLAASEKFQGLERKPFLKIKNQKKPVPLQAMGDGMTKILQIASKIPAAKNGILLIDEFENGLHWSVQEKLWDVIFTAAQKYNIQVFATTHSLDCVRAFAKVATARQQLEGVLLSMGRSPFKEDNNKVVASIYDESSLDVAIEGGLELR